ncbi:hypothetical protein TD95_002899 [Thielaviopsis punctulata]|uniref:Tat pathway signal sequence n=1 Tax=Thielaviopsis punctulata TaxID=72032 RepID=A0A0F4ZDH7_9PEZI|nr:hypothetical protein TD95_002899 [Thielaviopsis punctulata]
MPWTLQSPFRHEPAGFQLVANPASRPTSYDRQPDADADADVEDITKETAQATILKDVDISYAFRPFNGSFMRETIFRQTPSPAVDDAWASLGLDSEAGVIPYDDGLKAGLTPGHVQRNAKYGGGFVVNLEGMHHLHCLNLLRKALYFNVDYYRDLGEHAFKNEERILQLHITHCLDTLRQVLMCNVDTGILGQVWYNQTHPKAFPDFNTQHKCKNFEDIRDWAVALQIDKTKKSPPDFLAPPLPGHVYPTMP